MDSLKLSRDVCRICLEHRENINWNNKVKEFCEISYKDCYYKYTQLVEPDSDHLPTKLCKRCANELKNAHLLFEMALESLNILQNIFESEDSKIVSSPSKTSYSSREINNEFFDEHCVTDKIHTEIDEVICYSPVYDHTIEEPETEINFTNKEIKNPYLYKENSESFSTSLQQQSIDIFKSLEASLELNLQLEIHGTRVLKSFGKKHTNQPKLCKSLHQTRMKRSKNNCRTFQSARNANRILSSERSPKLSTTKEKQANNLADDSLLESVDAHSYKNEQKSRDLIGGDLHKLAVIDNKTDETAAEQSLDSLLKELFGEDIDINALGTRKSQKPRELMCQYCSVKVNGSHHLRAHEATHLKNRERNIICPKCGIKLYTKEALHEHRKIHEENRKKKHKCEYCEKAFFHSGALNVHRRIHLGLMTKCQLCPKEFYRQIDLDRHMRSHSATTLQNNDMSVKKKKYKIQCQYCNKAVVTTKWKAHKAAHLNQPQVQCKICDKNFFSRHSCSSHLRKTHRKERNEIEENIHYYVDCSGRMSHLMMKQQESLIES